MTPTVIARALRGLRGIGSAAVLLGLAPGMAGAATTGLIRDAEIEGVIHTMAAPVLEAAQLDPEDVHFAILSSMDINAFATGDNHIFLTTGLIEACERYPLLLAVIAHEVAHLAGGHVIRRLERHGSTVGPASALSALSILAGVATGSADLAIAGVSASSQVAERSFLGYSRAEETAADHQGLRYLEASGVDPAAMLTLMAVLGEQQDLYGQLDPYTQSHPLAAERIRTLQERVASSPQRGAAEVATLTRRYARARAKLVAFRAADAMATAAALRDDATEAGQYGRAIALHRSGNLAGALALLDSLQAAHPDDAYLLELRGQILFESGKVDESLAPLRRAVELAPDEPLIVAMLGQALLALGTREADAEAVPALERAVETDKLDPRARRLLARALARCGKPARAALMTAEERLLLGDATGARRFAERALAAAGKRSAVGLRALDILVLIDAPQPKG